jgi:hypothetical protein
LDDFIEKRSNNPSFTPRIDQYLAIIQHLGAGESLPVKKKGFFSDDKRLWVKKNKIVLRMLGDTHRERNDFAHTGVVNSSENLGWLKISNIRETAREILPFLIEIKF